MQYWGWLHPVRVVVVCDLILYSVERDVCLTYVSLSIDTNLNCIKN